MSNRSRDKTIITTGGLDLISGGILKQPGMCISSFNYEAEQRGYRRRDGYEVYDGRPEPHKAWPQKDLTFTSGGTTEPSVNDILVGATSGAKGVVVSKVVTSGSWGSGDAAGFLILRNLSGTFEAEDVDVVGGTSNVLTASGAQTFSTHESEESEELTRQADIATATSQIAAAAGSGEILGGFTYNGDVYCFRNNAGGTAAVLYKADETSGWVAQSFGDTIDFTIGTAEFSEGDTVTGGTSGATATIKRVIKQSGAWSGTATGYLVLDGVSGTFQAETITSAGGSATCSGAQSAITLPAGGKYRTVKHNFYGTSNLRRVYGVNGEGYAFEWDGSVLAPIKTGLSVGLDKPTHIGVLSNHLFLGYRGGAMNYSAPGLPLVHDAVLFAGSLGLGEDITGVQEETSTALIVTGRNAVAYLTGTDNDNFDLRRISQSSGAIEDTLQVIDQPLFVDDIGLRKMTAVEKFGDWEMGTESNLVRPFFKNKKKVGASIVGSIRVRERGIYRLFWDDKSFLSVYWGRGQPEFMVCELGVAPVCFWSGEDADGNDILFFGDASGFVYRMDAGQSDNNSEMTYFLRTCYMHQGMPGVIKRYPFATVEFDADAPANDLKILSDYSYGKDEGVAGIESIFSIYGTGGNWDEANWDQFYWSQPDEGQITIDLNGIGENISFVFAGASTYENPHTIEAITVNYLSRKKKRGNP